MSDDNTRMNIHIRNVELPDLVSDDQKAHPMHVVGSTMNHNDAMSGSEIVTVLAGPLMITTSESVHYLIKFEDDSSIWLCYPEDLTPIH